jgi:EamA domain-containing membrane protein RarD
MDNYLISYIGIFILFIFNIKNLIYEDNTHRNRVYSFIHIMSALIIFDYFQNKDKNSKFIYNSNGKFDIHLLSFYIGINLNIFISMHILLYSDAEIKILSIISLIGCFMVAYYFMNRENLIKF